jgi:hypothetical protein
LQHDVLQLRVHPPQPPRGLIAMADRAHPQGGCGYR